MRTRKNRLPDWATSVVGPPRLLLAAKTAVAAVLAWYLAPFVPFAQDEYSYYAPLGVLVTMYPTIARSARSGSEALAGLVIGIGVGFAGLAVVYAGLPGGVALGMVVLVGVLLGGIRRLGVGRDWVALAALFVLLVGGRDPEYFSMSYFVNMGFGVIVGVLVNLVVVPPLYFREAGDRLSVLRDSVAGALRTMADGIREGTVDPDDLAAQAEALERTVDAVTEDVREARESAAANPRRRRHVDERDENDRRAAGLARSSRRTQELGDVLARMSAMDDATLSSSTGGVLAEAIDRVADLVATPIGTAGAAETLAAATDAASRYQELIDVYSAERVRDDRAAAYHLLRIIEDCRPFM